MAKKLLADYVFIWNTLPFIEKSNIKNLPRKSLLFASDHNEDLLMLLKKMLAGLALGIVATMSVAAPVPQDVQNKLKAMLPPDIVIKNIQESPIADIYQLQIDGGKVLYMTKDGKYLLQGYLFELVDKKEPRNLTLEAEEKFVANLINSIDRSKMVIYPAKDNKPLAHVTIFTDTSCPYCHKLHQGVPTLVKHGIEVRYLAFPREGFASQGFEQLQKVWCADDKQNAMNQFMQQIPVKSAKKCDSPVIEQYVLGQKIGIRGTPAIILANGRIIPGYMPIDELVKEALAATPIDHTK